MGLLNLALVAKDRDKLLKKGLVSRLVLLLRHPQAGHFAAGALANLTAGSKTAARQAAEAGAVKLLVASLQNLCEEQLAGFQCRFSIYIYMIFFFFCEG